MDELSELAARVGAGLRQRGWTLVSAESCTGGWIAQAITSVAGSSAWFDRAYVSYSNRAKQEMLGVAHATLEQFGAVSEPTVCAMAAGALAASGADVAVAVSGIAGPGGGSALKPVGTVCFAWARRGADARSETHHLQGDREAVRRQCVVIALAGALELTAS